MKNDRLGFDEGDASFVHNLGDDRMGATLHIGQDQPILLELLFYPRAVELEGDAVPLLQGRLDVHVDLHVTVAGPDIDVIGGTGDLESGIPLKGGFGWRFRQFMVTSDNIDLTTQTEGV